MWIFCHLNQTSMWAGILSPEPNVHVSWYFVTWTKRPCELVFCHLNQTSMWAGILSPEPNVHVSWYFVTWTKRPCELVFCRLNQTSMSAGILSPEPNVHVSWYFHHLLFICHLLLSIRFSHFNLLCQNETKLDRSTICVVLNILFDFSIWKFNMAARVNFMLSDSLKFLIHWKSMMATTTAPVHKV